MRKVMQGIAVGSTDRAGLQLWTDRERAQSSGGRSQLIRGTDPAERAAFWEGQPERERKEAIV